MTDRHARSLGGTAMHSMFWSLVQNWGGRMLNFVQFVVLARFLSPQDFGLAAAAAIITLFITLVAEFGFADAIIQRPGLQAEDINLPFYLSIGASCLLAVFAIVFAGTFERWLEVPGLAKVVMVLSPVAPITTVSMIQESVYKRELSFKMLAFRIMIANVIATCVSVPCAIMGFGVWSLVIQTYLVALIGAAWIWRRPLWKPGHVLRPAAAAQMGRFGISVVGMRLLDFASTRTVEVLMIRRFGVQAYGFYTTSSKLNQTLMDLLQAALNDVSLSLLSKISDQRERLAVVYRTSIAIAGNVVPPIFVAAAALSPEICSVLFDERWKGIDRLAMPLFLLSAIQALQFFSRPYLNARGRSEIVLLISTVKTAGVLLAILLAPSRNIFDLVHYFVLVQVALSPVSFGFVARELKLPYLQVYTDLAPIALACAGGFVVVYGTRGPFQLALGHSPFLTGIALGLAFGATYAALIALFGRRQLNVAIEFVQARLQERKCA
jgi:O-antigen/teichoic acid export membrane protein